MSDGVSPARKAAEKALHNRLVLSLEDLEEARRYALLLIDGTDTLDRTIREGLTAALVVAYGRCFAAGRRVRAVGALPALPDRFRKGWGEPWMAALHGRLDDLRDEEFAHSDADAAQISIERYQIGGAVLAVPAQRPLRAEFTPDELESVVALINDLHRRLISEFADIQHRLAYDTVIPVKRVT